MRNAGQAPVGIIVRQDQRARSDARADRLRERVNDQTRDLSVAVEVARGDNYAAEESFVRDEADAAIGQGEIRADRMTAGLETAERDGQAGHAAALCILSLHRGRERHRFRIERDPRR